MVGCREIQPRPSRLERNEHDGRPGFVLKSRHDLAAILSGPVETREGDARFHEVRLDLVEEARPLREDESLVPVGSSLGERFEEPLDLGR